MSHSRFEEQLGPWLDGELTTAESQQVEGHLQQCEGCRLRVEQMRHLSSAIRQLERHPMPAGLKEKLMTGDRTPDLPRGRWLVASLAAAAGIVLAVLVLRPGPETNEPEVPGPLQIAANRQDTAARQTPLEKASPPEKTNRQAEAEPAAPPPAKKAPSAPASSAGARSSSTRRKGVSQPVVTRDESPVMEDDSAHRSNPAADEMKSAAAGELERGSAEMNSAALSAESQRRLASASPAGSSPVARYQTELIVKPSSAPSLGPIVVSAGATDATQDSAPGAGKTTATGAGAPTASQTTALGFAKQDTINVRLTFLVRLGQDGKVVSAEPVGARLVSVERVRTVQTLLTALTLPPRAQGDPTLVVVEVLVPADR